MGKLFDMYHPKCKAANAYSSSFQVQALLQITGKERRDFGCVLNRLSHTQPNADSLPNTGMVKALNLTWRQRATLNHMPVQHRPFIHSFTTTNSETPVQTVCRWTAWSSPSGSPGWGCRMPKDPKPWRTPGTSLRMRFCNTTGKWLRS